MNSSLFYAKEVVSVAKKHTSHRSRKSGAQKAARRNNNLHQQSLSELLVRQLIDVMPLPAPPEVSAIHRRIFVFYEKPEDAGFLKNNLNRHTEIYTERYEEATGQMAPELKLETRSVTLDELETICSEERCENLEVFAECHFLEIYKICPEDLVVAIGEMPQKILRTLKAKASKRPDKGARFFTMAEALAGAPPIAPNSSEAYRLYFEKMVERLYAE